MLLAFTLIQSGVVPEGDSFQFKPITRCPVESELGKLALKASGLITRTHSSLLPFHCFLDHPVFYQSPSSNRWEHDHAHSQPSSAWALSHPHFHKNSVSTEITWISSSQFSILLFYLNVSVYLNYSKHFHTPPRRVKLFFNTTVEEKRQETDPLCFKLAA